MPYNSSNIGYSRKGEGPVVLLLHGLPSTRTYWEPLVQRIGDCRTTVSVDLPGFGASLPPQLPEEYALRNLATTLLRFADEQRLERFDVVGHSLGGALAVTLAATAPDRIRSLAVITPLTDRLPPVPRLGASPLGRNVVAPLWSGLSDRVRGTIIRQSSRLTYGSTPFATQRAELVATELNDRMLLRCITGLLSAFDSRSYHQDILSVQNAVGYPVLLVTAGRDRVIPAHHTRRFTHNLARALKRDFPNGGHDPVWQYPDVVAGMVREFWGELS